MSYTSHSDLKRDYLWPVRQLMIYRGIISELEAVQNAELPQFADLCMSRLVRATEGSDVIWKYRAKELPSGRWDVYDGSDNRVGYMIDENDLTGFVRRMLFPRERLFDENGKEMSDG